MFGPYLRCQRIAASRPPDVHTLPDAGARERVSHKSLPDEEAADRNGPRPVPDRAPDQNLVSKPTHEAQEGDSGHQGAQRTGQSDAYQRRRHQLQFVQRIHDAQRRRLKIKWRKKKTKKKQTTTAKSNHLSYSYSQIFFNFFLLISLYKKNMFFVYILSSIPNLPHTSLKFATQPKLLFSFLSFWNHQTQIHSSQCIIKPFKGKLALSCLSLKTIIIHSLSLEIYFIRIKCTSVVVVAQKQKDKNFTFYFVHVQHEIWKKEKKMKIENHVRVRARPWYLRENETRTKNSMYTYSTNIFFFCFSIQFTLYHVAGIQKEMKENTLFCSYSYTISVYNYIHTSVALNTWGFSLWKIVTLDVATYFLK